VFETVAEDPQDWREELVARAAVGQEVWHRDADAARAAAEERVHACLDGSEVHRLTFGGQPAGWCWVGRLGTVQVVHDVFLPADAPVAEVRDWLLAGARAAGARGLLVGTSPEHPETSALVDDGRFSRVSTRMCLELGGSAGGGSGAGPDVGAGTRPRGDAGPVELRPMSEPAYLDYAERVEREYAAERHASGEPLEEAERIAAEQMAELLPDGLQTRDTHLFTPTLDGEELGVLWLATDRPVVYIYDIELREELRGRGLGRAVMAAAVAWSAARGAPAIGLNVFGHNDRARALYDRLGFRVVEDTFRADLG
jgi:ribosomal protein S18 acetylase RimI-like enzyme